MRDIAALYTCLSDKAPPSPSITVGSVRDAAMFPNSGRHRGHGAIHAPAVVRDANPERRRRGDRSGDEHGGTDADRMREIEHESLIPKIRERCSVRGDTERGRR